MQVSIETLPGLERRMTIEVPAEQIDSRVQSRLQKTAASVQLKGFRKGKAPAKVIKARYGAGVRQEVIAEVMSQSWLEAVYRQKVSPAGQPVIEPKSMEEGQNLEFVATFEVYPEVRLGDFSKLKVVRKKAEISGKDIDDVIESLRRQRQTYRAVARASQTGDQVNVDYFGTLNGKAFAGGEAKGSDLALGSGSMLPEFEEALAGLRQGEEKTFRLTFPADYPNAELAGQEAEFKVKANEVREAVLPELDNEFFAAFNVAEGGLETFRKEVAGNMARELKNAVRKSLKQQVIDGLLDSHQVAIPNGLLEEEIKVMRERLQQSLGMKNDEQAPAFAADLFKEQAEKRVRLSLIMREIVRQHELQADPEAVKSLIEGIAASYEKPEEVVRWHYSDERMMERVKMMALEDAVIDLVLASAQVEELETSYAEALKPPQESAP